MFDEFGRFIDPQQLAIQQGTMSPVGANPQMAPNGGWFSNLFSGGNGDSTLTGQLGKFGAGAQLGLGALGTLGGLMQSRQMLGLARDQFKHARDVTNTNLTNQIQSYNTALSDRARTRAVMEGRDQESANKYIEENKLRR